MCESKYKMQYLYDDKRERILWENSKFPLVLELHNAFTSYNLQAN